MSLRRRRDFYDEADFMYEKDRQEKVDNMKEQDTGAMTRTEDEYAHVRKEMESCYRKLYYNLEEDLNDLVDLFRSEVYLDDAADDLKEVLDKYF